VQYCRGAGAKGRLFALDNEENTAIIELPSKLKKIFPLFSVCAVGRLMGEENKFFHNTKSGYWRMFGRKSTVRGVAQNPVDHPHGGERNLLNILELHEEKPQNFNNTLNYRKATNNPCISKFL
jgi:ribosomal protein L2